MSSTISYQTEPTVETVTFDVQQNGPNSYIMRFFGENGTVDNCRPVWKQEYIMWERLLKLTNNVARLETELALTKKALKLAKSVIDEA